jgi:hypothetical protein
MQMKMSTMNITIQHANEEELDELLRVDRESGPEELAGSDIMIRSALKIFQRAIFEPMLMV